MGGSSGALTPPPPPWRKEKKINTIKEKNDKYYKTPDIYKWRPVTFVKIDSNG